MKSQALLTALTMVALAAATACGGSALDRAEDVIEAASERFAQMHDIMAENMAYYDRRLEETTACPAERRLARPQFRGRSVTWRQIASAPAP